MSVQFCVALLALCSLAAAASDPACEELTKPLENRTQILGKWILHGSISESKEVEEKIRVINSSWIVNSAVRDSDEMIIRWADRTMGKCIFGSFNYTFTPEISPLTIEYNSTDFKSNGRYLEFCPDCLVWLDTMTNGVNGTSLYIFTRDGKLSDSHLETFKKQASCVGLPTEMYFLDGTNLCPPEAKEEKESGK